MIDQGVLYLLIPILLIVLGFIFYRCNSPKVRGKYGEKRVAFRTEQLFTSRDLILRNLYLPWGDGSTTEIDEVVISRSGIYVFEVKNYSGWIFGRYSDHYWTQVLPKGYSRASEKHRFLNPIIQNGYHVKCIKRILKSEGVPIHSIVVFSDGCKFKRLDCRSSEAYVIHYHKMNRVINRIRRDFSNRISQEEVESIYKTLNQASVSGWGIKKKHISEIHERSGRVQNQSFIGSVRSAILNW